MVISNIENDDYLQMVNNSYHSGTVTKALPCGNSLISKYLLWEYVFKTFNLNNSFYAKIISDVSGEGSINIKSSVYLMTSSRDNQSSYAFREALNSLFTVIDKLLGNDLLRKQYANAARNRVIE